MLFKHESLRDEYYSRHTLLLLMAQEFEALSYACGVNPVVTRVLEHVAGSSGVHEAGRGIDFRDEHGGKRLYTDEQVEEICAAINAKYKRSDGKVSLLHHGFAGGPKHFHMQLAANLEVYKGEQDEPKSRVNPQPSKSEQSPPKFSELDAQVTPVLTTLLITLIGSCLAILLHAIGVR